MVLICLLGLVDGFILMFLSGTQSSHKLFLVGETLLKRYHVCGHFLQRLMTTFRQFLSYRSGIQWSV